MLRLILSRSRHGIRTVFSHMRYTGTRDRYCPSISAPGLLRNSISFASNTVSYAFFAEINAKRPEVDTFSISPPHNMPSFY